MIVTHSGRQYNERGCEALEQIAVATKKSVEEIKAIISKRQPVLA